MTMLIPTEILADDETLAQLRARKDRLRHEYVVCATMPDGQAAMCRAATLPMYHEALDDWIRCLKGREDAKREAEWVTLHASDFVTLVSGPDALAEPAICKEPVPDPSWLHRLLTWPGERLVEAGRWLYLLVHPQTEKAE